MTPVPQPIDDSTTVDRIEIVRIDKVKDDVFLAAALVQDRRYEEASAIPEELATRLDPQEPTPQLARVKTLQAMCLLELLTLLG